MIKNATIIVHRSGENEKNATIIVGSGKMINCYNCCRFGENDKNATIIVGSGEMIKMLQLLQVRGK